MAQERQPQVEIRTNYFENLTIANIYGEFKVPPGTHIMTDIPNSREAWEKAKEDYDGLCKKYGISSIGAVSYGGKSKFIEITAGLGPPICTWAPHQAERQIITELSHALSTDDKPVILDVGCGSGFLSKVLAEASDARVVGVDKSLGALKMLPRTSGDVNLIAVDFFDFFEGTMPQRNPQTTAEIRGLIQKVNDNLFRSLEDNDNNDEGVEKIDPREMYFWARQHNFDIGPRDKFKNEIKRLQNLTKKFDGESPVDIAISSFMASGQELTIPIRDGVHPRCIVYIRPTNGLSGVTDFYTEQRENMKPEWFKNSVMSFHPGDHYKTVARWDTLWEDDWGRTVYQGLRPCIRVEKAEVVVQLRKDVKVKKMPQLEVPRYGWDNQIEEMMSNEYSEWNDSKRNYEYKRDFSDKFTLQISAAREVLKSK